jgi:hypothetical protein
MGNYTPPGAGAHHPQVVPVAIGESPICLHPPGHCPEMDWSPPRPGRERDSLRGPLPTTSGQEVVFIPYQGGGVHARERRSSQPTATPVSPGKTVFLSCVQTLAASSRWMAFSGEED